MKRLAYVFLSAFVLAAGCGGGDEGTTGDGNLVVNGSFESPAVDRLNYRTFVQAIPGWTPANSFGFEIQNHISRAGTVWEPFDGDQYVELDAEGNGGLYQDLPTIGGRHYSFSVAYSPRPGASAATSLIGVYIDNTLLISLGASGTGLTTTGWQSFRTEFTAPGPSTRLTILAEGTSDGQGLFVDNVSVLLRPEIPAPPPPPVPPPPEAMDPMQPERKL